MLLQPVYCRSAITSHLSLSVLKTDTLAVSGILMLSVTLPSASAALTPAATNPYLNYPAWPAPTQASHPSSIDDLWHATINGRGAMFMANNASELTTYLRTVINSLLTKAGSDSGISVSNVNLKDGDNTAYVSSYNAQEWSGQLAAYPVNISTGQVDMTPTGQVWEAREKGVPVRTVTVLMQDVDRAITDRQEVGFVKLHVAGATDTILGATIVASRASDSRVGRKAESELISRR